MKTKILPLASLAALLSCAVLTACHSAPKNELVATVGDAPVYLSDIEFMAGITPPNYRTRQYLEGQAQQLIDLKQKAEAGRRLVGDPKGTVDSIIAAATDAQLAQVYSYFYLRTNLGQTTAQLAEYYKNHLSEFADTTGADSGKVKPFFMVREQVAAKRRGITDINAYLDSLMTAEKENLTKIYHVELAKIPGSDPESYYEAHKEDFKTKATYQLLQLADKDSAALAKKVASLKTEAEFKAAGAAEMPLVKDGHAVMGLGMMPALFDTLRKAQGPALLPVFRAPQDSAYHAFYLQKTLPGEVKPFDRAKKSVEDAIANAPDAPLDSTFVLATMDGKPLVTEADVQKLKSQMDPRRAPNRSRLLDLVVDQKMFARAAKEAGWDKSPEYLAWMRSLHDQHYAQRFMDSVLSVLAVPNDSLLAAYNIEKDSLFSRAFDQARTDVAVWLRLPDIAYRREFALNANGYPGDSTWQEAKRSIYKRIRYREFRALQNAVFAKYQREFPVTILDTSWHITVEPSTKEALLARAAQNTEAQNFGAASEDWLRLRALFPEDEALQKTATDSLAGLYQALERFADAETEYHALYAMWPNDKDAYKPLFMRGFIYFENLKNNDKALEMFEELVQKFPNCELADDAQILVNNIKSGGKYFEDLQKKIDSTAAADSAKAANAAR
jgi:hypothetical protein